MARIAILSSSVADQIAAGEVVERPSSVVKELVENSLDAGAHSVDVMIEEGGHKLIRVSDDGCGIDREDVSLALVRHGTSKIKVAADLVGVSSFGFRGEALPAIASISRFELDTCTDGGEGSCVIAAGGTVASVSPSARRRGTTVSVAQLFYNTPARKKFLKGARSEWRAISEALVSIALTRPDARFNLSHDGKAVLVLAPVSSLRARVSGIWGGKYAGALLDVNDVTGTVHTSGLVERPADVGTSTRRVFLSVNGRAVRDMGLVRAAEAAYRSTISAGLRPSLFLNVTLPVSAVDVNVHPAKAEIRFLEKWPVERAVESAVRRALGTFDASASVGGRYFFPTRTDGFGGALAGTDSVSVLSGSPFSPGTLFHAEMESAGVAVPSADPEYSAEEEAEVETAQHEPIPDLFQFRRTYIAFEHQDGLVLIDQHSAHERVLYEEFMHALETGSAPGQRLLLPLTLHLGPAEADAFEENRAYLEKLGFEIEGFGGSTLIVNTVPMPHARFDAEKCLRETLDALTGDRVAGTATRHEHLAATVACKAAIKAGEQLSASEMRALFASLRDTKLPAHDVHGRSTIVQLTWDELDRRFGRK